MEVEPELPIAPLQKTQEEGDQMFAQSFQQKPDEDELPVLPNSTCKMRAGCRGLATSLQECKTHQLCAACYFRHESVQPFHKKEETSFGGN